MVEAIDPADNLPVVPPDWQQEFEAAAARPLAMRVRYGFIRTYKPVLDDAPYRAFTTLKEYRDWCGEHLPSWLGYGRVCASVSRRDLFP